MGELLACFMGILFSHKGFGGMYELFSCRFCPQRRPDKKENYPGKMEDGHRHSARIEIAGNGDKKAEHISDEQQRPTGI